MHFFHKDRSRSCQCLWASEKLLMVKQTVLTCILTFFAIFCKTYNFHFCSALCLLHFLLPFSCYFFNQKFTFCCTILINWMVNPLSFRKPYPIKTNKNKKLSCLLHFTILNSKNNSDKLWLVLILEGKWLQTC